MQKMPAELEAMVRFLLFWNDSLAVRTLCKITRKKTQQKSRRILETC